MATSDVHVPLVAIYQDNRSAGLVFGRTSHGLLFYGNLTKFDKEAPGSYVMVMRAVGLKVLKNKLSEYIRLAASGETILVTDRDHVVAEISPPGATRAESLPDVLLAEAVRKGWLKPALISQTAPPPRLPVKTFRSI